MDFYFLFPVVMLGSDGNKRMVAEAEMEAVIEQDKGEPYIAALYAFELAPGKRRFEVDRDTEGFRLAMDYLRSNPQEQDRLAQQWEEHVAEELPGSRSVVNEHSTLWGRPT